MSTIDRKNSGKLLTKSMTKYGTSKMFISKLLGVGRPYLDARLIDGKFTFCQLQKLQAQGFLPKDKN
jgi:hypothetical protein